MSEEIVKILKLDTGDSQQTIKGLKQEISDLRDNILNLEKGTDEYDKAVDKLQSDQRKLDETMSLTKRTATALDGSYDALTQRMSLLKKEWRATSDEAKRDELGKQISKINDELKEMDASVGNFQRNVGDYTNSIVDAFDKLNQEIGEYQNKAAQAYQAGDADAYAEAIQKIGEKQGVLDQINKDSEFMNGSLEKRMQNLTGIAEGVAGGFGAIQGIMALAGGESEEFEKTMVKLSSAMAIVQGIQGMQGFVGGLKGFRVALKASCAGLNGFKKALIGTGIGAIIVLVGTLVANWEELTKWIENSIGSLDKFREVFAGIKETIGSFFSNMFKALGKAFQGEFKEAGELMKKAVDFKANYEAGASAKSIQIAQNTAMERAKISKAETEDYIKDQEAKSGADWKWSKEGIASYRKMYDEKLKMYKKDSEEYKNAQREKWAFERELADKRKGPDISKLADEIAEGITIEDEPIAIEEQKFDFDKNKGKAQKSVSIGISSKERELRRAMNETILMDDKEAKAKQLELEQKFQEDKMALIEQGMKDALADGDLEGYGSLALQKADLEIEIEKNKNEELKRLREEDVEDQKSKKEQALEITTASLDTVSNALGAVADLYQSQAEAKVKSGKMSEEQYKKEMEKVKAIQIAQATISTIAGAIDAYMSMSKVPIVGPALGAIAAATVTATGIAQIAKMKSTDVGGGSTPSLGGGMGSVSPDNNMITRTFEPEPTRNITGRSEVDELNRTQRVVLVESDLQESLRRVQIREDESSF